MAPSIATVINRNKLIERLSNVNGNSFIGLDTLTRVPLRGGIANPFRNRVEKFTVDNNVIVFTNQRSNGYDNMVRRRLTMEGKNPNRFELSPRPWGTRIPGTPFVEHDDKWYLEVIFLRAGMSTILVDGTPYYGQIEGMIEPHEAVQGGLDDKVILRTFKLDSLVEVRVDGRVIELQ